MHGDTGGVDLSEGEVGQVGAFAESLDGGGTVAAHGVGGEEEGTAVTAGGENHGVCGVALDLAGDEVAHDHTACAAVDDDDVEHLAAHEALDGAFLDLTVQRGVGAKEELLAGLAFGVECTRYLRAAEGAVGQEAAVLTGERHALSHALVDDVVRYLGQTVNVGFARTEVAAFHGVVEETVNGVAVVLVVLCGVDTALSGDGVRAAGGILDAEVIYVETHLAEGGGCGGACETRTYHDDVEVALVGGVDEFLVGFIVGPLLSDGTFGDFGVNLELGEFRGFDVRVILHDGGRVDHTLYFLEICHF